MQEISRQRVDEGVSRQMQLENILGEILDMYDQMELRPDITVEEEEDPEAVDEYEATQDLMDRARLVLDREEDYYEAE